MNLRSLCALLMLAAAGACNLENPGTSPPPGKLAYPIALSLSEATNASGAPKYLYVANTNFDLHYNGASVQSYDLDELDRKLHDNDCLVGVRAEVDGGETPNDAGSDAARSDAGLDAAGGDGGPGADLDAGDAADGDASSDAEAVDAADATVPSDGAVDATLIGAVDAGSRGVVATESRRGRLCDGRPSMLDDGGIGDPENPEVCCFGARRDMDDLRVNEVIIDSYASGLASLATPSGADEFLYVTVRSRNRLVYVHADPATGELSCGGEDRCKRGAGIKTKSQVDPNEFLAPQASAVAAGPFSAFGLVDSKLTKTYAGFVATAHDDGALSLFAVENTGRPKLIDVVLGTSTRAVSLHVDPNTQFLYAGAVASKSIERVGVRPGTVSGLPVPYRAESLALNGLDGTGDVRDVLVDPRARAPGAPLRAYALVRGSSSVFLQSVVFLELDPITSDGRFARAIEAVRVGIGPSKLVTAQIGDRQLLFASCYDAGEIHVIDADRRQTVTVIRDVLGPFDMRVDTARKLMYVTDFRTSALRVVDLSGLYVHATAAPLVVATIGVPTTPGSIR